MLVEPVSLLEAQAPRVSVQTRVETFRTLLNESFVEVLHRPLPFKLPVINMRHVLEYPDILEFGEAEYLTCVDSWIECFGGCTKSDFTVAANDVLWQNMLRAVCRRLTVRYNATDSLNETYCPSAFSAMYKGMMVMRGEATWDCKYQHKIVKEMIDRFHPSAIFLFPQVCMEIPVVATSLEGAAIHRIYCESGVFHEEVVKTFQFLTEQGRVEFACDIMKLALWIQGLQERIDPFHLMPDMRTKTRAGNFITLKKCHLTKVFHTGDFSSAVQHINKVYAAKLPNVEQGLVHRASITITRVGWRLEQAISNHNLTQESAVTGVTRAVQQLHAIGIAHCDLLLENVFVDLISGTVFVGGLDRCRPLADAPPTENDSARAKCLVRSAQDLDNVMFKMLLAEIAELCALAKHKKRKLCVN